MCSKRFGVLVCAHLIFGVFAITDLEKQFLKLPDRERARNNLKRITSEAHLAGTPGDLSTAQYVLDQMRSYGLEAEIEPVQALLGYPTSPPTLATVNLQTGEEIWRATLEEDILQADRTSDTMWRNHTFLGYAPSGDVAAPVVYANYGRPEDFDVLQAAGVNVEGAIVLVRYDKCFRGVKVWNAQQRGAAAVIIYSDPYDDGFGQGDVYPVGAWRPPSGVQRGSVAFLNLCSGDPARLDSPLSTEETCGYSTDELLPSIPALPISYRDAEPLLQQLSGPEAPADFQGALNLVYRLGPSEAGLGARLTVSAKREERTIHNVVARIAAAPTATGVEDRPILLGNHRDAWVYGAADPNSGTATMMEVAASLGKLVKAGWRPKRSIYFLSWSGEEYNLIGSTAWAEHNSKTLLEKAVVYINCDTAVSGRTLSVSSTLSLVPVIEGVMGDVPDPASNPDTPTTLLDSFKASGGEVGILGSGSDYASFLHHVGIAAVNFEFEISSKHSRVTTYGTYHSVYDSFDWMEQFGDPGFLYTTVAAQFWGLLALRMSEPDILPFDLAVQAKLLSDQVSDFEALVPDSEKVGLGDLLDALKGFKSAAEELNRDVAAADLAKISTEEVEQLNDKLSLCERQFLRPEGEGGLPSRPWFKHVLQAPGLYLGYGAVAFPGIAQGIDENDWDMVQREVSASRKCIRLATSFISSTAQKLKEIEKKLVLRRRQRGSERP